jgi:hypothetical protein
MTHHPSAGLATSAGQRKTPRLAIITLLQGFMEPTRASVASFYDKGERQWKNVSFRRTGTHIPTRRRPRTERTLEFTDAMFAQDV